MIIWIQLSFKLTDQHFISWKYIMQNANMFLENNFWSVRWHYFQESSTQLSCCAIYKVRYQCTWFKLSNTKDNQLEKLTDTNIVSFIVQGRWVVTIYLYKVIYIYKKQILKRFCILGFILYSNKLLSSLVVSHKKIEYCLISCTLAVFIIGNQRGPSQNKQTIL